jgi:hypothetical protein
MVFANSAFSLKPNKPSALKIVARVLFLYFLHSFSCFGQANSPTLLLDDKVVLDSLRASVQYIYNFKFDRSNKCLTRYQTRYGNHAGFKLISCVRSYWKNFPIGSSPAAYESYKKELAQVVRLSEAMMKKYPKSPEPVYYYMTANLMLARHHSEDGEYIQAVNETRKAYPMIKLGFSLKTAFPDFYFTTGLYNYYREAFPENHPLYKPFTVFFPKGNKEQGLKELSIAGQKSYFSSAEAQIFQCNIVLRDYYNVNQALEYATALHKAYPENWVFSILYAETLAESGKTAEAEGFIRLLLGRSEMAALLSGHYIQGLIEKKAGRNDAARWSFQKALMYGKTNDRLTKGHIGLTYNELGKIAHEEGNRNLAKKYFRQASENCSYKKVKSDAAAAGY